MVAISAFNVSSETEFNALRFINYTIPRLCSTYAVATIEGFNMLLCQIRLILIILIWFGREKKCPFLKFLNNFLSMCQKISECLKLNRPGFGYYLLL